MTKGHRITYSQEELAWVKANASRPAPELHAAFRVTFDRNDVSQSNLVSLRKRNGWRAAGNGRFQCGHAPANKGLKGFRAPGSEKGWFRKGERRGVATKLYKPIGTERLAKGGYLERKIHDGMPLQSRWRAVHLINWEAIYGPLPKGAALKCLDGNRFNTDPANWEAVPRALLPRLAGGKHGRMSYDQAPDELKPALLAVAKLEHATRLKSGRRT